MTTFGRNPFKECNTRVPVDSGFIQDCKYAVCACYDHPLSCLCEEYDDYVTSCSLAGIKIQWRDRRQFKNCREYNQYILIIWTRKFRGTMEAIDSMFSLYTL